MDLEIWIQRKTYVGKREMERDRRACPAEQLILKKKNGQLDNNAQQEWYHPRQNRSLSSLTTTDNTITARSFRRK